jgi:hypothetical protein
MLKRTTPKVQVRKLFAKRDERNLMSDQCQTTPNQANSDDLGRAKMPFSEGVPPTTHSSGALASHENPRR